MRSLLFLGSILFSFCTNAQFHTLTLPKASPKAKLVQQLGVTFIEINYHSPAANGRDVWNNPYVIPQNGNPTPWRAGANENTTISFDTDVKIEGQQLKAGSYGFHIIPNGHEHTLLFAQPDNLWGSYYLNLDEDVVLQVIVKDTLAPYSERLKYEVMKQTGNSCQLALKWTNRMIPFTIEVDLKQTTVEKLRYELNGENTYQWEAWNDAAAWCVQHNTNLEEALDWVNRSMNGGYGGFAAHPSFVNLSTKLEILDALAREVEFNQALENIQELKYTASEARQMAVTLIKLKQDKEAVNLLNQAIKQYEKDWGMRLYHGIAYYYLGKKSAATVALKQCAKICPEGFKPRLEMITNQMKKGEYQFPQRKS
ncbi:MAG: hypothetical protein CMP59_05175 [Flavobacteriales bacterium]|nr:hypothetical protein [Flavobacteriales bacterium]|tara:strand:- start:1580 stop:2683 length:1104 start_codon:yes stop_codon:yes gene_type:complete